MELIRVFDGKAALYDSKPWGIIFDTDAKAFLLAAGITSPTISSAINTLVIDLKSNNLWTKMRAIYPFVGGTATSHKWNLKDPRDVNEAFRLSFNGGIVHTNTGSSPNGINAWSDTHLESSVTNFPIPTYISFSYYSRTVGSHVSGGNVIGSFGSGGFGNTSARLLIRLIGAPNQSVSAINYNDGILPNGRTNIDTDGSGFYISTRTSTSSALFIRGLLAASNTDGNTTLSPPPFSMYLFAYNNSGFGPLALTNKECAFSHIGDGLTNSECVVLTTIVNNFQTKLGRIV